MIDRIVRKDYNTYVIIFTHRTPVTISSSGNAKALLEYLMKGFNWNLINVL